MEINTEKEKHLKEAIVKTVAYFDIFDFPLTVYEIWQYLGMKCELAEVIAIQSEEIQPPACAGRPLPPLSLQKGGQAGGQIESKNGFYFLAGRSQIVEERLRRYNWSQRKFKRARLMAKIFKIIPWIKMIAVSNLMGADNLKESSDIDLFIITYPKRLWLVRFFCVAMTALLRLRPKANETKDKICLNFFISQEALDLEKLRLHQDDIYFTYWLAGLKLIYLETEEKKISEDEQIADQFYQKFIEANSWLKPALPNWLPASLSQLSSPARLFSFSGQLIDLLFSGLEKPARRLQLGLLPKSLRQLANQDTRVVVFDQVLKFHPHDRRQEYYLKWLDKVKEVLTVK